MTTYDEALKKYPDWAWAFNIPDVGNELRRAVDDPNYDPVPAILQTNWYRTTQASVRQWDALRQNDPASADARLREEAARVWDIATNMGVDGNKVDLSALAEQSLRMGWQDSQLKDAIAMKLQYTAGMPSPIGNISGVMQNLKKAAGEYMIDLSDETAFYMARGVVAGEHSIQDWAGAWADQAKLMFPTIAQYIDKGITPNAYFAPFRDRIANTLEVSSDSIKLNDPKWSKVLNVTDDKGNMRPMTYNEVDQYARSQDEFKSTRQGQQAAADMGQTLLKAFGKVA